MMSDSVHRVMITGSRAWTDGELIYRALEELKARGAKVFIHGAASGADTLGARAAMALGYEVHAFRADWGTYGKAAGPLRNQRMLDEGKPDFVIAFPLCGSKGTWDAVDRAKRAGIVVKVWKGGMFVEPRKEP